MMLDLEEGVGVVAQWKLEHPNKMLIILEEGLEMVHHPVLIMILKHVMKSF